jgi:hypothetical protein
MQETAAAIIPKVNDPGPSGSLRLDRERSDVGMQSGATMTPARAAGHAHLIASGLVGDPTAPVIGIAGATNMNS